MQFYQILKGEINKGVMSPKYMSKCSHGNTPEISIKYTMNAKAFFNPACILLTKEFSTQPTLIIYFLALLEFTSFSHEVILMDSDLGTI